MSQDKVFNSEFIDFFVELSLEDLREMSNMDTAVAIANDVENGADHIPSCLRRIFINASCVILQGD